MKIALLCSLVLAVVYAVEAGALCHMDHEKLASTILCMSEKIPTELKEKVHALNKEGTPFPEFIKKHCDSGTDYVKVMKASMSEEELASLKKAYEECTSA
ncbi:uncharacterized protein LOC8043578 [Ixodes scapularis]|uniref:uncharacterized protein LOC8043578 n=1 Tax=Ixodes scapularis TaxID=6945 RepID=UPI001A9F93F9|nr:uncharacterized protein LOC8043578 [Ixodes scapularis]